MVEFRACPFCGGEIDGPNFVQCDYGKNIITLGLTCKKCKTGFKFRADFTEDPYTEAREAWNKRVNDASVVHEKWLLDRWQSWPHRECSRCKIMIPRTKEVPDPYWQYCPNCGAKMDGGNEVE